MSIIHKLNEELIDKIAAGEVVERPASVVKELVENSLDAGARNIDVMLRDGGKKLIQVSDDGCGIIPEELELAISRHATSKISEFEDLYRLQTKGFRGEALASIVSVAQVTLASHAEGHEPTEIVVNAGRSIDLRACAQAPGTTVAVKHLFFQTPARLKFLRSSETETSHIVDVMLKLALSHPQVAFRLFDGDKTLLDVPVFDDPLKRVIAVLGKDLREWIYPFNAEGPGMQVSGWFGHPQVARSSRGSTYFFVNGRAVQDKVLWHAAQEAYRDLLMKGRYPVLVLDLHIDENAVDVNVHPAKSEVRFHRSTEVHAFIKHALREHLRQEPWTVKAVRDFSNVAEDSGLLSTAVPHLHPEMMNASSSGTNNLAANLGSWGRRYDVERSNPVPTNPFQTEKSGFAKEVAGDLQRQIKFGRTPYAEMKPIGQWLGTYILCESSDKLVLIDQHAAHERVGFEKLLMAFNAGNVPAETLLFPESFDLKPSDAAIFKNYLEQLNAFGFEVDYFGGNTFVLKATPILLKGRVCFADLVQDIISDIREAGELVSLKDRLHHVLATMACHAQIRAHHHLNLTEMEALLRELDEYQFTDFCPHGRPVSVEVTRDEVEKWFRRVL